MPNNASTLSRESNCQNFSLAISQCQNHIAQQYCYIRGRNQLTKRTIYEAAILSAEKNNWALVKFLCGLTQDEKINYRVIKKNNLLFYTTILVLQHKKEEEEHNREINSALGGTFYPSYVFNAQEQLNDDLLKQAFESKNFRSIRNIVNLFLEYYPAIVITSHIKDGNFPHCKGSSPAETKINSFLEKALRGYQPAPSHASNDATLWQENSRKRARSPFAENDHNNTCARSGR